VALCASLSAMLGHEAWCLVGRYVLREASSSYSTSLAEAISRSLS